MQALRELLFAHYPAAQERLMYGGIMFSFKGQDFGGIFPRKAHVSFEFGRGRAMQDPQHFLEGQGAERRHLKIKTVADIALKEVKGFLLQAIEPTLL